jgi:hypothetical protein
MIRSLYVGFERQQGQRRSNRHRERDVSDTIERVARVLEPQAWAALGIGDTLAYANRRKSSLRKARLAIEAMREPTPEMIAAALPCKANEDYGHPAKIIGAAAVMLVGGGKNIGEIEGRLVNEAAFLVRDYRLMIDSVLA